MRPRESYTGKLAEDEVFGSTEKGKNIESKNQYYSFEVLVELVKSSQPFKEPSNPDMPFPNDLHATIAKAFTLENYEQLKYYTAVGSNLDWMEGIDAFFELDLGNGESIMVTLDITLNPMKPEHKADVVFQWPAEGISRKEDREEWNEKVNEISNMIIEIFKQKAQDKGVVVQSLNRAEIEESEKIANQREKAVQRSAKRRGSIHQKRRAV